MIQSWQINPPLLTEQLKFKIIQKTQDEDPGILGAYRLFMTDHDAESFKARVIHKVLGGHPGTAGNNTNLALSAEERQSSMTTAGFNRSADYLSRFSRGSNAPYPYQQQYGEMHGGARPATNATINRFRRNLRPATGDESAAVESSSLNH